MKQGRSKDPIARAAAKRGVAKPQAIEEAPEISPGLEIFINAFAELDTDRPQSQTKRPPAIPSRHLRAYGRELGFVGPVKAERFRYIMRALDEVARDHAYTKRVQQENDAARKNGQDARRRAHRVNR